MKKYGILSVFAVITMSCAITQNNNNESRVTNKSSNPNIIFLLADDQNTLSVGCYGNDEVNTPNIDRLGSEGMIFTNHYNTTAICMASRASILTGMYEYKTGTNFNHGNMKPEVWQKSYPVLLREHGYLTAFAGKFGIEVENRGICEGDFDFWGGSPGQTSYNTLENESMKKYARKYPHSTLSYGAFGQDVIKESVKQKKPFCLSISFKAPHLPQIPDPKFDNVYQGKTFTKPKNFGRIYGEHMAPQSKGGRQYERFFEWGYYDNYDSVMAIYYQQVYAIDVALGMIWEELDKQGIAENTIIIYTSDNGFICGSHGYASKVLPMEESARVPMIIFDPRSKSLGAGIRCNALTGNIDFAPTILELAGVDIQDNMDGKSLCPLLEIADGEVREQLAFINTWGPIMTQSLTCITNNWKYTYWWFKNKEMEPVEELFDLNNDPMELENNALNPQFITTLEEMRDRYKVELTKWEKECVSYNNYKQYPVLFDPSIKWDEKLLILENANKREGSKK